MMESILYSEISLLCILILGLIFFKMKPQHYPREKVLLFRSILVSNCVLYILDALWIFIHNKVLNAPISISWTVNILYYLTSGVVSFSWFLFSENFQHSKLVSSKRNILLCLIPFLVMAVLVFSTIGTKLIFYIDSDGNYHRGILYVLQLILSYGYLIFTGAKAIYKSTKAKSYTAKLNYRALGFFVIPTLVAGIIQIFLPNYATLCIGTTLSLIYIFVTMQEQMIFKDSLTGINNRSKLLSQLFEKVKHMPEENRLFLVMMDLDYFKNINDKYGHVEGDRALKIVANSLKHCCNDNRHSVARYGGDEFAAICELLPEENIEDFCNKLTNSLNEVSTGLPYKLSLSFGYAEYSPDITTIQDFVKMADNNLYSVKKNRTQEL